jgi:excisionase family DNA binding protein
MSRRPPRHQHTVNGYTGPDRREYLTVKQVAEKFSLSDDAVYAAIRKGSLIAYRYGGSIRVRVTDALAWGVPVCPPSSEDAPRAR